MKTLVMALVIIALAPAARAQDSTHVRPRHAVRAPAGDTLGRVVPLPGIEVSTTRLGEQAPLARTVLGRDEVEPRNLGLDTPMLLATLPGAYAYSDAGNGIGYSYLSIRGFPQRRISVLIDGVPLNDPESNEVYWIDHPDLLSSTAELQLQRGVGSALYGGPSVGGSVNLELAPFSEAPSSRVALQYGSWNTKRLMVETNSGRLAGGWDFYGRYSRIETDGYRDQSWSKLWSYAFSARRVTGDHAMRLNLFGGPENTHLAYLGVPAPYLEGRISGDADRDRRFNPITYHGEQDHFFEPHYELIHTWAPRTGLALTQTLFWFNGEGYYDEQRFGRDLLDYRLSPWATVDSTLFPRDYYAQDASGHLVRDSQGRVIVTQFDLVRRRTVENRHYGWVPRARIQHAGGALTLGGELRAHQSRHWGQIITGSGLPPGTEPDHFYYDYRPRTLSAGVYAREEWRLDSLTLVTADLAWRHQGYEMGGDVFNGIRFKQDYDFVLPRLGITFTPNPQVTTFASWSASGREPAFRSLYDAETAGSVPLFANGQPIIKPEKVNDIELGGTWRSPRAAASVNLFRMDFRDELVDYQFNTDLGYAVPANAARSVHQGVELAGRTAHGLTPGLDLTLDANATFSDNRFVRYTELIDDFTYVVHDGKQIGFFPAVLGNLSARLGWKQASVGLAVQYASRMFLDNNESDAASIAPHTVLNLLGRWRVPAGERGHAQLSLHVLNLLDHRYAAGGYMDYDAAGDLVPMFVSAATRNWIGQVSMGF